MSEDIMLDPSMLFDAQTFLKIKELKNHGEIDEIIVPSGLPAEGISIEYWLYFAPREYNSDSGEVMDFLGDGIRTRFIKGYEPRVNFNDEVIRNLQAEISNPAILRTVCEEWDFLTSHSWLFSRIRKQIDQIINAGGNGMQISKKVFEDIVRKSLRKNPSDPITNKEKLRAIAKWVAIGGPIIWKLIEGDTTEFQDIIPKIIIYDP